MTRTLSFSVCGRRPAIEALIVGTILGVFASPLGHADDSLDALAERYYQPNLCGPIALYCVCLQFDISTTIGELADLAGFNGRGVTLAALKAAAEAKGLRVKAYKASLRFLKSIRGPAIIDFPEGHFCTFLGWKDRRAVIQDPPHDLRLISPNDLEDHWGKHVLVFSKATVTE